MNMEPSQDMVTISREEFERLNDRDFKLSCLESGGVDNWQWYSEALEDYWKKHEND
jgi:hypothetical protein